jgi:hypothetical protein
VVGQLIEDYLEHSSIRFQDSIVDELKTQQNYFLVTQFQCGEIDIKLKKLENLN